MEPYQRLTARNPPEDFDSVMHKITEHSTQERLPNYPFQFSYFEQSSLTTVKHHYDMTLPNK